MRHQALYGWAGITIKTLCTDASQAARLDHLLQTFFCLTPLTTDRGGPVISLYFWTEETWPARPPLLNVLWRDGVSSVWKTPTGLCLQYDATNLALDFAQGHADGILAPEFWGYSPAEQRDFFLRSLLMLLRLKGVYGLHANGVVQHDQGMLLIGASGSGKTTLALSLAQGGWRYLGDDVVVLRELGGRVEALALQRGFACTPQTIDFFPTIRTASTLKLDAVRHKRQVVLTAHHDQFTLVSRPQRLLFPTITTESHSRLEVLDETKTMLNLMQQSAGLLVDARMATIQLALLKQLIQQTRSYRLHLGRDVYTEPSRVATLLEAI